MTTFPVSEIPTATPRRSIEEWLSSVSQLSANSESLLWKPCGSFEGSGRNYSLPRYLFIGPRGGDDPIRIGLFGSLHGSGLYAFTRSYTVGKNLVEPALAAADPILPRNTNEIIDGFPAKDGVVRAVYSGAISGPPKIRPRPFEIALCAPRRAARYQVEQGLVLALQSILTNYRELKAYAQHL